jgi:Tol biopolymer transport system component
MDADPNLLALVRAVCDGSAVDWDSSLDEAGEELRAVVSDLRVVAQIADLHRSLGGENIRWPLGRSTGRGASPAPVLGRWGHLHLLEHVASGSFGDVYRAWDPAIDREVALKLLRARGAADDDQDESIEEGRLLARVRHPNVVTVYGAARIDGRVGIWMEFVRGRTLVALVRQDGPLTNAALIRVGGELCDAVAAVHDAGLLHRDIKAQNAMMSEDGRVVLMDLGAGRFAGETRRDLVGTPLYLAPEVIQGRAPSVRSDIYSLGVLLHFLATGSFPAPAGATTALPPPRLDRIVRRATAANPDVRYANARELRQDLDELVRPATAHRLRFATIAAGLLVAAGLVVWRLKSVSADMPPPRLVPLTQMPGAQGRPTFSPDGTRVAFQWWSDRDEGFAIYLKTVGSSEVTRLVSGEDPSWSPDGHAIAFTDAYDAPPKTISPQGTGIRTLGDIPSVGPVAWSPDSRYVAVARPMPEPGSVHGIYLVSIETGKSRLIARSPVGDGAPAWSPDGRRLAYASESSAGISVVVLTLDAQMNPADAPRRVTRLLAGVGTITWTRDGRDLVYGGTGWPSGWRSPLWRVPADGGSPPQEIQVAGPSARDPIIAPVGYRLAFDPEASTREVYRFVAGGPPVAVLLSSFFDLDPDFSSSGARLAFSSTRAGDSTDIWISNADGSDPHAITHGPGNLQSSPSWSPDDQEIAFAAARLSGSDQHIWIVNADGSNARELTHGPGGHANPSWSRDGRWVYFTSNVAHRPELWRVSSAGGTAVPVITTEPVGFAHETADGRALLYDSGDTSPLRMLTLSGGPPRTIVACENGFASATTGVYYLTCARDSKSGSRSRPDLRWLNADTGEDRLLGSVNRQDTGHDTLAVSPDESAILYSRWNPGTSGLWMIENFR